MLLSGFLACMINRNGTHFSTLDKSSFYGSYFLTTCQTWTLGILEEVQVQCGRRVQVKPKLISSLFYFPWTHQCYIVRNVRSFYMCASNQTKVCLCKLLQESQQKTYLCLSMLTVMLIILFERNVRLLPSTFLSFNVWLSNLEFHFEASLNGLLSGFRKQALLQAPMWQRQTVVSQNVHISLPPNLGLTEPCRCTSHCSIVALIYCSVCGVAWHAAAGAAIQPVHFALR